MLPWLDACAMMTTPPRRTETERWRRERIPFPQLQWMCRLGPGGASYALAWQQPFSRTKRTRGGGRVRNEELAFARCREDQDRCIEAVDDGACARHYDNAVSAGVLIGK
jgi:hypothetical protein